MEGEVNNYKSKTKGGINIGCENNDCIKLSLEIEVLKKENERLQHRVDSLIDKIIERK